MFAPHLRPTKPLIKLNEIPAAAKVRMVRNSGILSDDEFTRATTNCQKSGIMVDLPTIRDARLKLEGILCKLGFAMAGGGGNFQGKKGKVTLDLDLYAELVAAGIAKPLPSAKRLVVSSGKKRG